MPLRRDILWASHVIVVDRLGPHLTGRSTGSASPPSFRWLHLTGMSTGYASPPSLRWTPHRDVDGLYAPPPSSRWATSHRDVGGFCLATIIPMCYTSPGCGRVMPRHHHFDGLYTSPGHRRVLPRHLRFDGLHLTGMSTGICLAGSISWGFIIHVTGRSTGLYARRVLCVSGPQKSKPSRQRIGI